MNSFIFERKIFLHLLFLSYLISVSSCRISNDTILSSPDLSKANLAVIYFKSEFDDSGKMKIKTFPVNSQSMVSEISDMINSDPFDYQYCIYTGSIDFYNDSTFICQIVFNTTPGIKHIAYNFNNQLIAVKLSDEDSDFLESFNKKFK